MTNSLDQQIRLWLARYLRDEVALDAFEEWFTPATWDVDDSNPVAQGLAGEIGLRLAEFTSGDLSEDELRDALRPLAGSLEPESEIQFSGANANLTKRAISISQ